MSAANGVSVIGPDARRMKWSSWFIVLVAGARVVGRMHETAHPGGPSSFHLAPWYDFNSGFVMAGNGALAEVHRVFPPMALSLKRLDLPQGGYVSFPFSDLDDSEIEGMETQIAQAEDLWKQMRAARSGILAAPGLDVSRLPKLPKG